MSAEVQLELVTPEVQGNPRALGALAARLAKLDLVQSGWSAQARRDAKDRLEDMGLPKPRDEYWRYTDPAPFVAAEATPIPIEAQSPDSPLFEDLDRLKLVFVDGNFDAEASDDLTLSGIEVDILSTIQDQDAHWSSDLFGALEAAGQKPIARPLAALNTMAAQDGVLIRVSGQVTRPVHLIYRRSSDHADVYLRHVLRLEEGAELTLLETGMVGARANVVLEIDLAAEARLHHVMAKRAGHQCVSTGHVFARLARKSVFKSFALAVNGTVMRQESVIDFQGDDGVAHIAAAVLGDGNVGPFHHDDTVFVTHGALRCESRQVYKKVLKNGAMGVFQGKILVKKGAQKTDGYQISQALLLDENSQFLAKPELEIYADDVVCSHGSTTGAIDETALFYLRTRGIPRERAIVLMVLSFLAAALEEVEDPKLRTDINDRLEAWLTRRAKG